MSAKNQKIKAYRKYTGQERYQIGKYASENGNTAAVRHFKGNNLNESTVREFKKTYQIELKNAKMQKRSPRKSLHIAVQDRPKKMQALDEKVQNFLLVARGRGSIINTAIAIATATGFMQNSNDEYYSTVTLGRSWVQSLFRRMGFVCRSDMKKKQECLEIKRTTTNTNYKMVISKTYNIRASANYCKLCLTEKLFIIKSLDNNNNMRNNRNELISKCRHIKKNLISLFFFTPYLFILTHIFLSACLF